MRSPRLTRNAVPVRIDSLNSPLLEVRQLRSERDDRVLFDALCFSITGGEIVQVEGENGSGKTTLLRILSGLSSQFEGEVFWRGQPLSQVRECYFAERLFLGHLPAIKKSLTPLENLAWQMALVEPVSQDRLWEGLANIGLKGFEDVPCHSLSAGQQRRVALARLCLCSAPLWILDEPFTAIDKRGVALLESLIERHVSAGGAVILTTHQPLSAHWQVRRIVLGEPI